MEKEGYKQIVKGTAASPGKILGQARIINENNLTTEFNQGDILITQFTSPLFIPLIKRAGAIITDQGGLLCHASIIAREFGIPCIVGTEEATSRIKEGQIILVDADEGVIYAV